MRRSITIVFLSTLLGASSYNTPPTNQSSRRQALNKIVILPFLPVLVAPAFAAEEKKGKEKPETEEEKKARVMKEKIAASKINYRKPEGKDKLPFRLLNQK